MEAILTALSNPEAWIALVSLLVLEIVLGIDNIVFISILAGKLPESQRKKARSLGLMLALVSRIILLFCLTWIMKLTTPLFTLFNIGFSGKSMILLGGGLFLIAKATHEIHNKLEGDEHHESGAAKKAASFAGVLVQIMIIDIVFSLDSVITAVGMANQLWVMITAVVLAVIFMLLSVNTISDFVERHPTVKMLCLAFLVLIGVNLIADGLGQHIPKGYTYFAMAFSVGVEFLNMKLKGTKTRPVQLRSNTPE